MINQGLQHPESKNSQRLPITLNDIDLTLRKIGQTLDRLALAIETLSHKIDELRK